LERYQRQLILPEWGTEAQDKLKAARVFVAGAGGLGCPAALNLALAGVGHIVICDFDMVDMSNLNRQFLHPEKKIGSNKARSAQETLSSINSQITIESISHKITNHNVDDLVGDAQIILDCLDNFPDRHVLNMCAIRKGIPMVHGAIWGLEGRIIFLNPPHTPCLKCIFTEGPPAERLPVLGAVACITGSLQALEAVKFVAGVGELLLGRMLIFDGATTRFQELEIPRDPHCDACGGMSS
jgi:adenylyltransferase/sulfurtransferase